MQQVQKIRLFRYKLFKWYKNHKRIFDWRKSNLTPYEYIIAEVLLQRTKAETVARFYASFIKAFPNWKSIAEMPLYQIEEFLRPIGLFRQRSQRLKSLAIELVTRNERFPSDRQTLEAIPFMGQYIANSVELMVFDRPSPLIDVNMARVVSRVFGVVETSDIRFNRDLQLLSKKITDHRCSKHINWAILDFAALVCKARKPLCLECPLKDMCVYFNSTISQTKPL